MRTGLNPDVIEGEQNGVRVLIFDSLLSQEPWPYYAFIACQTESSPFEKIAPGERILKSRDWRILYDSTTLIPWAMSISDLERHLDELRTSRRATLAVEERSSAKKRP